MHCCYIITNHNQFLYVR